MNSAAEVDGLSLPPLGLYVHLPWCVRKCPYCDFNSQELRGELPAEAYVDALLRDLEQELPLAWGRPVQSVFLGGGTPSLFPVAEVARMIDGFRARLDLAPGAEITLEANPGTVVHDAFAAYREAGVNRVSLGVQSFDDRCLQAIGRIHGGADAEGAVESLQASGIRRFNLDLMYGLPGQSQADAVADVETALGLGASHVSHYQLTLEPNTLFHARPPALPGDEACWAMQEACAGRFAAAGLANYEISAWSRPGEECRHNLNYWHYGDFIGIGAGAHGKLTLPAEGGVRRRVRRRHPRDWMQAAAAGDSVADDRVLSPGERLFEYFLNTLRLRDGVPKAPFTPRTGLAWGEVEARVAEAVSRGLLEDHGDRLVATPLGWRFLNDIQALFLPP